MKSEALTDWLAEQKKCDYMRGPWNVVERWNGVGPDAIMVEYRGDGVTITIGEWLMNGCVKNSPGYYMVRAHADMLAAVPELLDASRNALLHLHNHRQVETETKFLEIAERHLRAAIAKAEKGEK